MALTLAALACGCALPGAPINRDLPVYPERHENSAWSSFGVLAYCDLGVSCVRSDGGGYSIDDSLRGTYIFDPRTGRRQRIAPGDWSVSWHPTEPLLAYGTPAGFAVADTSGSIRRVVELGAPALGLAWSPDGRWLAWYAPFNDAGIWIIDPETGSARKVAPIPGPPAWGASSDTLLTISGAPGGWTYVVAYAVGTGHADTLRSVPLASWDVAADPDGRSVVIAGRATGQSRLELYRVELASGLMTRLTSGGASHPAIRRSDGAIAFVRSDPWSNSPAVNVLYLLVRGAPGPTMLVPAWPSRCE